MAIKKKAAKAKTKVKAKAKAKRKVVPTRKAAPKRKVAPKKAAAKKKPAVKKAAKKKAVAKKKPAVKKKTVAKKRPAVKKKTVAKKKPAVINKSVAKKKPVAKKKATTAKKAAPKKQAAKKAAPKRQKAAVTLTVVNQGTDGFTPYNIKRGEDYMNENQKEHFKQILRNWRNDLMEEVDRTVHHMQDEAANPPDPADRATLEEEFSIELRTRDRERRLIKKIDSTIEMIANDDYGWCDSCGVEIGIRRLEARPTANKCIDCKTLDEIKEKQLGGL